MFERLIRKRYFQQEPDEDRLTQVREEVVPDALDFLETVADERGCVVGGRFSIADCAIGAQLQSWALGGEEIDGSRWPNVRAYSQAILPRPSFKAIRSAVG